MNLGRGKARSTCEVGGLLMVQRESRGVWGEFQYKSSVDEELCHSRCGGAVWEVFLYQ